MNQDELVEAIIKEVKRVLTLRGISVSSSSSSSSDVSSISAVSTTDKVIQSVGSSDLTGKQIITQKDLEAFKGQSITVSKKAVITPLAFDYAREKGIAITKVEQPSTNKSVNGNSQPTVNVGIVVSLLEFISIKKITNPYSPFAK